MILERKYENYIRKYNRIYLHSITILVHDSVSFGVIGRTDTCQLGLNIKLRTEICEIIILSQIIIVCGVRSQKCER